jgi:hypothetical protein
MTYMVQFQDEESGDWKLQRSGRYQYERLAWASRRASKLMTSSGKQYRVADEKDNLVWLAQAQLKILPMEETQSGNTIWRTGFTSRLRCGM